MWVTDRAESATGSELRHGPLVEEAQRLLIKHRSSLDRVAQALLDKETLDRAELEALLKDIQPESRSSETVGTVRALPLRD